MTFHKPSTITSQTGAYAYKQSVSSPCTNYIDNNFPNILDKTGDTAALGGGISGEIEILHTGSMVFDVGSSLTLNGGSVFNLTGDMTVENTAQIAVNSGGEISFTGGSLLDVSGTALFFGPTTIESTCLLTLNGTIAGSVNFDSTVLTPGITQNATSSTGGATLTISAQNTSLGGHHGGNIVISTGSGTSGSGILDFQIAGYTDMYLNSAELVIWPNGTTGGAALGILPWNGTFNSQVGQYQIYQNVVSTLASGANIPFLGIPVANDKCALIEIAWIRRGLTGSGCLGNKALVIAICNGAGTVTLGTLTTYVTAGGAFDAATNISLTTSPNNVNFAAIAQTYDSDWQITVTVSYS